jgi:lysophospholipase L1-like esterase
VGQYATLPQDVQPESGSWPVYFQVLPMACRPGASYRWAIDGAGIGRASGDCHFEYDFPHEGSYQVRLDITAPSGNRSSTARVTVQDWLVVSLGDSVASGEGNPEAAPGVWANQQCHRSSKAGAAQAALRLEQDDPATSVTFVHLACSGATIGQGLIGGYAGIDPPSGADWLRPQIDQLADVVDLRPVDAVLLSIGANDIHFGAMSIFCMKVLACMHRRFDPGHPLRGPLSNRIRRAPSQTLAQVEERALADLPTLYEELDDQINERLPPPIPPIYLIEYFDPTIGPQGPCSISGPRPLVGISKAEAQWAHDHVLQPLNKAVAAAADDYGWTHVEGVASAFRGHGYCAGRGQRWVRTVFESLRLQRGSTIKAALAGTLHPNERGHLETARRIEAELAGDLREPGGVSSPASDDSEVLPWAALGLGLVALLGAGIGVWTRGRSEPGTDPPNNVRRPLALLDQGPRSPAANATFRWTPGLALLVTFGLVIAIWRRRHRPAHRRPR